jgi:hypothetical protein
VCARPTLVPETLGAVLVGQGMSLLQACQKIVKDAGLMGFYAGESCGVK